MKSDLKFSIFEPKPKVIPTFVEKDNNGRVYVGYGSDNKFPNYLWDLYLRSALLQSIVDAITDYTEGSGIDMNPALSRYADFVNADGEIIDDIIKRIVVDYLIFGGFAIQIIYNKLGEVNEIYWLDFRNIRTNKDNTEVYYNSDWVRKGTDFLTYKVYNPKDTKHSGSEVFYFKGHITRGAYPIPRYNGALSAIETSTEISKYHHNSILNNFNGNLLINFNNGQPDEETQGIIERKIADKFSGAENASKFLVAFNDSKENGVTIERIGDDNQDKKYENLRTDTYKEIFTAFRIQPQLLGYSLEGTAFNKQEFEEAFDLFYKTTIKPIQRDIIRCFDKIFKIDNSIGFLPYFKIVEGE